MIKLAVAAILLLTLSTHAQVGTQTAGLEDVEESPWGGKFKTELTAPVEAIAEDQGKISLTNQVAISYSSGDWTYAIKPTTIITRNVSKDESEHVMGNTALEAKVKDVYTAGTTSLDGIFRLYLPTGAKFQEKGTRAVFYAEAELQTSLGYGFKFKGESKAKYYWQTERSFAEYDEVGRIMTSPKANKLAVWQNSAEIRWKATTYLSLFQKVGLELGTLYDEPELGIDEFGSADEFKWETGVKMKFDPVEMKISFKQAHELDAEGSFVFYGYDETAFYFELEVSI